jgi:hypothetical protein
VSAASSKTFIERQDRLRNADAAPASSIARYGRRSADDLKIVVEAALLFDHLEKSESMASCCDI